MTKLNPNLIPRFNIDYNFKDLIFALSHLNKEPDTSFIDALFQGYHIHYTNSGRSCLYTILIALNLPSNSNIGVPLYTCTSDFDAIVRAGHKPVFLDISPQDLTLDPVDFRNKIGSLDAVVVVHTFGRPAQMDIIKEIANGKPVIEDCAHSLLSKYNGNLTGTIGNAGFFSFRSGKYISAGEGGIIITKDCNLSRKIEHYISTYPNPSIISEIKHTFLTFIRSFLYHKPWFGLISLPLGKRIEKKVDVMNKYSFDLTKIRKTNLHIINAKFQKIKQNVSKNTSNAAVLASKLNKEKCIIPSNSKYSFCNYFLYPVLFKDPELRDYVCDFLMDNGVDTAKMFSTVPDISRNIYGYKGDCLSTEFVAKRILIIPHYYTLNSQELRIIHDLIVKLCK